LFRERLGECINGGIGRGHGGEARLGIKRRAAGHENHGAAGLFQRVPCPNRQAASAVELQLHAGVPLLIGHLEEIDLWNGACDIQQRVDSSKTLKCGVDDSFRRLGPAQVEGNGKRLGSSSFDGGGDLFKFAGIARRQDDSREIARQTNRGGTSDALAAPVTMATELFMISSPLH